jgi:hypothetical protein
MNCMRYESLNRIRAGVVKNPAEWAWCGDDELTGRRSRYRLLSLDRMLEGLGLDFLASFVRLYRDGIGEKLQRQPLMREAEWTEALAIGDPAFVERVAGRFGHRRRFAYSDAGTGIPHAFCVREATSRYRSKNG